jgi:hypothetical protein
MVLRLSSSSWARFDAQIDDERARGVALCVAAKARAVALFMVVGH